MSEPIHVDFRARRRIERDCLHRLCAAASSVRMFMDRETNYEYAVDVVIPDPRRDRRPFIQVSTADIDCELEERIERGWPWIDFDFVLTDRGDLL